MVSGVLSVILKFKSFTRACLHDTKEFYHITGEHDNFLCQIFISLYFRRGFFPPNICWNSFVSLSLDLIIKQLIDHWKHQYSNLYCLYASNHLNFFVPCVIFVMRTPLCQSNFLLVSLFTISNSFLVP